MVTISRLLRPFTRRSRPASVTEPLTVTESAALPETAAVPETAVVSEPVTVSETVASVTSAPKAMDVTVIESTVDEPTIVEYSVPVLVQRPVDRDTSRAEEALYELVRERVLGMVGPGGTFNVSMRTENDDDLFFSQAFAQLIARELVSQLQASSRPAPREAITAAPAGAITAGRSSRGVHALSHESRLIA